MNYEKRPERIYEMSFAQVRQEADLDRFTRDQEEIAIRVVHACGMVDIASQLVFSPRFDHAGRDALMRGAPIHCDGKMTAAGIIRRLLPAGNRIVVSVDSPEAAERARKQGTTRSAAAVDEWLPQLDGSIAVIGNAPTALYRLLEIADAGGPAPALVIGFPVGFVGAAESKTELMGKRRGFEYLTLPGRQGGSAMAAAAVNAIASGCRH